MGVIPLTCYYHNYRFNKNFIQNGVSLSNKNLIRRYFSISNALSQNTTATTTTTCSSNLQFKKPGIIKQNILAFTKQELYEEIAKLGLKKYRVDQIWKWLYCRGITKFTDMKEIKKDDQITLDQKFKIDYGTIVSDNISNDTTRKWGIKYGNAHIESVFIPNMRTDIQGTLCFSSQYGCSLKCSFCATGHMSKTNLRNLKPDEIIGQILSVKTALGDFIRMDAGVKEGLSASPHHIQQQVSNLVGMGMGEPGYNWKNVKKAMSIVMDPTGLAISKNKITISTSGVLPVIPEIAKLGVNLAISLHSVRNDVRDIIVPINKTYPLSELWKSCVEFVELGGGKICFEYTLLKGINDSFDDALELAKSIQDLEFKALYKGKAVKHMLNIIPFNPWEGSDYKTPDDADVSLFSKTLNERNVISVIRWPRGRDIGGACGQLEVKLKLGDTDGIREKL